MNPGSTLHGAHPQRPSDLTKVSAWATAAALTIVPAFAPLAAQLSDTAVLRAGAPLHQGVGTLVEELTLGNGSDADEYRFTNAFVYGGRNGTVYVTDLRDPTNVGDFRSDVRQYDRTGNFVRAFGRIGQGPGEYTGGVADVQELPDGRVLLSDGRGVLVYSPTGEPLARWKAQASSANMGSRILVDRAGFVSVYSRQPGEPARYLHRFRFDGIPVDVTPATDAFPAQERVGRAILPFTPRYVTTWSPLGYFVTARTSTYAIDLRMPRASPAGTTGAPIWRPGDPVRSIRHSTAVVPVQDAERADWRQSVTMFNRYGRGNSEWTWEGPDIPREKPPLRDLYVDVDGRIWVQLSQPARLNPSIPTPREPTGEIGAARHRWLEPLVFDVFEPSGRYVGRVRFPDGVGDTMLGPKIGFAIQGDTAWAVSYDQDDVPIVKRYRIRWGS